MHKYSKKNRLAMTRKAAIFRILAASVVLTPDVTLAKDKLAEVQRLENAIAAASQSTCRFFWDRDKWIVTRVYKSPTKLQPWSPTALHCPALDPSVAPDWQDLLIALGNAHAEIVTNIDTLPKPKWLDTAQSLMNIGTTFLCARLTTGSKIPPSIQDTFAQAASLAKSAGETSIADAAHAFHLIWHQPDQVHDKGEPSCLFSTRPDSDQPNLLAQPKRVTPRLLAPPKRVAPRQPMRKGVASPIDHTTWQLMQGKSWHPKIGCPKREELSLLSIPYIDFFGQERTGEMIVAKSAAKDVLAVFAELHRMRFPIASMRIVDRFDGNDAASMAANNTSAFNCRSVTGGSRLSEHAYGTAIDINPIQNPYVAGNRVQPPSGQRFVTLSNRQRSEPGLIVSGDVVVAAFARIGWKWGGAWTAPKDYQHFSKTGR